MAVKIGHRARQINFRVSDDDYVYLRDKSKDASMTMPTYAKQKALDKNIRYHKFDIEHQKEIIKYYSLISNNLNQITKKVHTQGLDDDILLKELNALRKECDMIWQLLN